MQAEKIAEGKETNVKPDGFHETAPATVDVALLTT
jgi:hypothetical protein